MWILPGHIYCLIEQNMKIIQPKSRIYNLPISLQCEFELVTFQNLFSKNYLFCWHSSIGIYHLGK